MKDGKSIKKLGALITALIFTLTNSVFAAPALAPIVAVNSNVEVEIEHFVDGFNVPEMIGTVDARHQANSVSTVIHIQDAHGSFQAQENIKALLEEVSTRHGVETIFVEGASEEITPELFQFFHDKNTNDKLVPALVRDSLIGGPEWFVYENTLGRHAERSEASLSVDPSVAPQDDVKVYGVEDQTLYQENLLRYRNVLRYADFSKSFIEDYKTEVLTVGSKVLNKNLKKFMREWLAHYAEGEGFFNRFEVLKSHAHQELDLDLSQSRSQIRWPQLVRLAKLTALEKKLDVKKATVEAEKLKGWMKESGLNETLVVADPTRTEVERFYEVARQKDFIFDAYQALATKWAFSILKSELNAKPLMAEIESLTQRVLDKLIVNDQERELVQLYQDSLVLEKLFSLELVETQHRLVIENKNSFMPSSLKKRLSEISKKNSTLEPKLDNLFRNALNFYEVAKKREHVIFSKMTNMMKELNAEKVALVTGGFHAAGLSEMFEANGISYVQVMPKISHLEESDGYLDAMMLDGDYTILRSHAKQDGLANILARHINPVAANLMTTKLIRTSVEISPTQVREGLFDNMIHQIEIFQLQNGDSVVYRAKKPVMIEDDDDKEMVLAITDDGLLGTMSPDELEVAGRSESRMNPIQFIKDWLTNRSEKKRASYARTLQSMLGMESLESRQMMAGDTIASLPMDVNQDGYVTPADALTVINEINENGSGEISGNTANMDVNQDGYVSPADVLGVINHISDPEDVDGFDAMYEDVASTHVAQRLTQAAAPAGEPSDTTPLLENARITPVESGTISTHTNVEGVLTFNYSTQSSNRLQFAVVQNTTINVGDEMVFTMSTNKVAITNLYVQDSSNGKTILLNAGNNTDLGNGMTEVRLPRSLFGNVSTAALKYVSFYVKDGPNTANQTVVFNFSGNETTPTPTPFSQQRPTITEAISEAAPGDHRRVVFSAVPDAEIYWVRIYKPDGSLMRQGFPNVTYEPFSIPQDAALGMHRVEVQASNNIRVEDGELSQIATTTFNVVSPAAQVQPTFVGNVNAVVSGDRVTFTGRVDSNFAHFHRLRPEGIGFQQDIFVQPDGTFSFFRTGLASTGSGRINLIDVSSAQPVPITSINVSWSAGTIPTPTPTGNVDALFANADLLPYLSGGAQVSVSESNGVVTIDYDTRDQERAIVTVRQDALLNIGSSMDFSIRANATTSMGTYTQDDQRGGKGHNFTATTSLTDVSLTDFGAVDTSRVKYITFYIKPGPNKVGQVVIDASGAVTTPTEPTPTLPAAAVATASNPNFYYAERSLPGGSPVLSVYDIYSADGTKLFSVDKETAQIQGNFNRAVGVPDVSPDASRMIMANFKRSFFTGHDIETSQIIVHNMSGAVLNTIETEEGDNIPVRDVAGVKFEAGSSQNAILSYADSGTETWNVITGTIVEDPTPTGNADALFANADLLPYLSGGAQVSVSESNGVVTIDYDTRDQERAIVTVRQDVLLDIGSAMNFSITADAATSMGTYTQDDQGNGKGHNFTAGTSSIDVDLTDFGSVDTSRVQYITIYIKAGPGKTGQVTINARSESRVVRALATGVAALVMAVTSADATKAAEYVSAPEDSAVVDANMVDPARQNIAHMLTVGNVQPVAGDGLEISLGMPGDPIWQADWDPNILTSWGGISYQNALTPAQLSAMGSLNFEMNVEGFFGDVLVVVLEDSQGNQMWVDMAQLDNDASTRQTYSIPAWAIATYLNDVKHVLVQAITWNGNPVMGYATINVRDADQAQNIIVTPHNSVFASGKEYGGSNVWLYVYNENFTNGRAFISGGTSTSRFNPGVVDVSPDGSSVVVGYNDHGPTGGSLDRIRFFKTSDLAVGSNAPVYEIPNAEIISTNFQNGNWVIEARTNTGNKTFTVTPQNLIRSEARNATLDDVVAGYGFGREVIDEVFRLASETASPKLHEVMSEYLTSVLGPELSDDAMLAIERAGAQNAIDVMRAAISPKYAWLFNSGNANENAEMTVPVQGVPTASELSGIIANHLTNPRDEINVVLHDATETQAESLYEKLVKRTLKANPHSSIAKRLNVIAVNDSKAQLVRTLQKIVGSKNSRVSEQALISAKKNLLEKVGHRGARLILSPEKLDENTAITITAVMLRDQVVADGYSIEEIREWANAKGIDLNLLVKRIAQALKALDAVMTSA